MNSGQDDQALATRASLLERLKDCEDHASWQQFHDRYRGLMFRLAVKAGCTETEAEEVVQDTLVGLARKLPEFRYEPERCAFKTWLLNLTLWRAKDRLRRRQVWERRLVPPSSGSMPGPAPLPGEDDASRTATVERVADDTVDKLTAFWEEEYERTLLREALARVKREGNPKDCQMFELHVMRGMPPREVARTLGVARARVYLAKHRILPRIRKELAVLAQAPVRS